MTLEQINDAVKTVTQAHGQKTGGTIQTQRSLHTPFLDSRSFTTDIRVVAARPKGNTGVPATSLKITVSQVQDKVNYSVVAEVKLIYEQGNSLAASGRAPTRALLHAILVKAMPNEALFEQWSLLFFRGRTSAEHLAKYHAREALRALARWRM